jgi:hypothetical protein
MESKRPLLLTVLCILTFIGSGLNIFSSLFIGIFFEQFVSVALEIAEKFNLPGVESITQAPRLFFFSSALFYIGSLAGAVFMWNMRKIGFHIYTVSQILLIIAPMYFMKLPGPSLLEVILSALFIILYSIHLRLMR